ncbi:hypothetical protein BHYA_0009g00790 [Botrytis hyacinthi]|uniref:Uncharacterized protein n=1 Tax=Botrytis hyacinthi TaxID=278943 RepID=A0A4Z1H653_9HELO|nr:hypothetical protein BHYA_0009g00790 [Botrytis hyacinthi]
MGRDKTGMCHLALPSYLACLQTIHRQYSIAPCKRDVRMQSMLLEKFVDSYQHLIQPLETGTGLTFRSSRVRDEVSKRSHRNRQLNLHTNIDNTFTLNATVTMISQVKALMPDAGKAKEDTAVALVMVTDG